MTPRTEAELAEAIASAQGPLRVRGGDTRPIGRPQEGTEVQTAGLSGVSVYEPGALTLVAQAGTPISEIESLLDAENQRLAFEPIDHRTLLGSDGTPTLGGMVATNASGARRISVGACRDHVLGVRFVDGSGRILKNGGRVMKNVTGYDLAKVMCGSFGTLGVLSEVSLKVLPKPETSATLVLNDLSLERSVSALSAALGSPYEVTGAATYGTQTCIRIEGFAPSVDERFGKLTASLASFGEITRVDHEQSVALWTNITEVAPLKDHSAVMRVSVAPSAAPTLAQEFKEICDADIMLDWGGGLMWVGLSTDEAARADTPGVMAAHHALQRLAAKHGGHATLIKGPKAARAAGPVFQPENPVVARLSQELRDKFDPRGILNPGLMT